MKKYLVTFDGRQAEQIQAVDLEQAQEFAEALAFDTGEEVFVKRIIPMTSFCYEKPVDRQFSR